MNIEQLDIMNYFLYLFLGVGMLVIFTKLYFILTPYDEIALIRQGKGAALISLSGTLIGFSLTLAASAIYNNSLAVFLIWSLLAMIVQLAGYWGIIRVIGNVEESIALNNTAVGGLIGLIGLVLGIINSGCLS